MAVTGLQIITRALKALAQLEASETPGPNEAADGLVALNGLLGTWGLTLQGLPAVSRLVLPLVASQASYTVGVGADLNTRRFDHITRVSVVPDAGAADPSEWPLDPPLTTAEWQAIPLKTQTSTIPTRVHYDRSVDPATGYSRIYVYPIPSTSDPDLIVYAAVPLADFDLHTAVELPNGWERALRTNLALELAPDYGAIVHPELASAAREAKAALERANNQTPVLQMPVGLPGTRDGGLFDIFAGR